MSLPRPWPSHPGRAPRACRDTPGHKRQSHSSDNTRTTPARCAPTHSTTLRGDCQPGADRQSRPGPRPSSSKARSPNVAVRVQTVPSPPYRLCERSSPGRARAGGEASLGFGVLAGLFREREGEEGGLREGRGGESQIKIPLSYEDVQWHRIFTPATVSHYIRLRQMAAGSTSQDFAKSGCAPERAPGCQDPGGGAGEGGARRAHRFRTRRSPSPGSGTGQSRRRVTASRRLGLSRVTTSFCMVRGMAEP